MILYLTLGLGTSRNQRKDLISTLELRGIEPGECLSALQLQGCIESPANAVGDCDAYFYNLLCILLWSFIVSGAQGSNPISQTFLHKLPALSCSPFPSRGLWPGPCGTGSIGAGSSGGAWSWACSWQRGELNKDIDIRRRNFLGWNYVGWSWMGMDDMYM